MGIALEPEDFDKLRMEHAGLEIYYVNDFRLETSLTPKGLRLCR